MLGMVPCQSRIDVTYSTLNSKPFLVKRGATFCIKSLGIKLLTIHSEGFQAEGPSLSHALNQVVRVLPQQEAKTDKLKPDEGYDAQVQTNFHHLL